MINWFEKAALIPSLPKVALDLIETFKMEDPDPQRLSKSIEADAVLCARVLRLANSPYYATTKTIKSIQDALLILGYAPVRNIALSAAVSSLGKSCNGMDIKTFSKLTLLSGLSVEFLYEEGQMTKGEAFAAGLLRPIGLLLMRSVRPQEMRDLDLLMDFLDPRRLEEERKQFGLDHGELSGLLAERWKLPSSMIEALSGDGLKASAVKLGYWAACKTLAGIEREKEFSSYAPAQEWAHVLNLSSSVMDHPWPTEDDSRKRFGGLME